MKLFYLDTETTGLNPKINDIIQFSIIIEIDGIIKDKHTWNVQPFSYDNINDEALKINKLSVDEIKYFPIPKIVFLDLIKILDRYINKYDKNDKFFVVGYNVRFDIEFLNEFFIKNECQYFGSYFDYHIIDVMQLVFLIRYAKNLNLINHKLETVCNFYDIPIKSHDAESDIQATRELFLKIKDYVK